MTCSHTSVGSAGKNRVVDSDTDVMDDSASKVVYTDEEVLRRL